MPAHNPLQRFSTRVENYLHYRPGYPAALYKLLAEQAGLQPGHVLADLGSGTGLLSALFLPHGHTVYAIEPNAPMRAAAERLFANQPGFVSLPAQAECIPLADRSVDFVVAGQAFHWFQPLAARAAVRRILRPAGQAALVWNRRAAERSAFMAGYEQLLTRFATDFAQVDHQRASMPSDIDSFFGHSPQVATMPNRQVLDWAGLQGRLLSSSYAPSPDSPTYGAMLAELRQLFDQNQHDQLVNFDYVTETYFGSLH